MARRFLATFFRVKQTCFLAFTSFITNASGGLEVGLADPSLGGSGAVERQRIKINTPPQVMLVAQNQHWLVVRISFVLEVCVDLLRIVCREIETENDVVYATGVVEERLIFFFFFLNHFILSS